MTRTPEQPLPEHLPQPSRHRRRLGIIGSTVTALGLTMTTFAPHIHDVERVPTYKAPVCASGEQLLAETSQVAFNQNEEWRTREQDKAEALGLHVLIADDIFPTLRQIQKDRGNHKKQFSAVNDLTTKRLGFSVDQPENPTKIGDFILTPYNPGDDANATNGAQFLAFHFEHIPIELGEASGLKRLVVAENFTSTNHTALPHEASPHAAVVDDTLIIDKFALNDGPAFFEGLGRMFAAHNCPKDAPYLAKGFAHVVSKYGLDWHSYKNNLPLSNQMRAAMSALAKKVPNATRYFESITARTTTKNIYWHPDGRLFPSAYSYKPTPKPQPPTATA